MQCTDYYMLREGLFKIQILSIRLHQFNLILNIFAIFSIIVKSTPNKLSLINQIELVLCDWSQFT